MLIFNLQSSSVERPLHPFIFIFRKAAQLQRPTDNICTLVAGDVLFYFTWIDGFLPGLLMTTILVSFIASIRDS